MKLSRTAAQLLEIQRLAKLRELDALEQMAQSSKKISERTAKATELREKKFTVQSTVELHYFEKWQVWRQREMREMNMQISQLKAAHGILAKKCGRLIAESEVIGELISRMRKSKR